MIDKDTFKMLNILPFLRSLAYRIFILVYVSFHGFFLCFIKGPIYLWWFRVPLDDFLPKQTFLSLIRNRLADIVVFLKFFVEILKINKKVIFLTIKMIYHMGIF